MKKLSPLEIVKRTPGTNCGECGLPSCLAFGAAVVAGGRRPSECPHITLDGLPEMGDGPVADQKARDLEFIAFLKTKIADFDFAALAPALGAETLGSGPDAALELRYLGQVARVAKDGVLLDGLEPADHRDQILLYNYVYMRGGSGVAGEWLGMESLPNSISKVKTLATYAEEPLARFFTGRSGDAGTAFAALGGAPAHGQSADFGYVVPVLPMLPLYVLFWDEEPEDDFAAKVKILFDRDVLTVLDLESLVFAAERLADAVRAGRE